MSFPRIQLEAETRRFASATFDCAISLTFNRLRDRAPRDLGELYASGSLGDITRTPTTFGREIKFTADYALYTDTGTRPHPISARTASVLTNGDRFFGKTVQHPGTPRTGWFTDNAAAEFAQALDECATKLA